MQPTPAPHEVKAVERNIRERTWGRIRRLQVQLSNDRLHVRGTAPSYYMKQLVIQAIREILPSAALEFAIDVSSGPIESYA